MEYSNKLKDALIGVFSLRCGIHVDDISNPELTLDKHNVFNRMLVVDISSNEIEIPVLASSIVENIVITESILSPENQTSKVIIPMYVNGGGRFMKSSSDIISFSFLSADFSTRLYEITTSKGEVYYGGSGIIFDKDFNILLLCTIACRKTEYGNNQIVSYHKPIIHVNPQIFLEDRGLIGNAILRRIIPFYISHSVNLVGVSPYFRNDIPTGTKPQILIDDASKFIEKPAKPIPQEHLDDTLNQLLIDNIGDITNQFML